jgi:hypothetical protein
MANKLGITFNANLVSLDTGDLGSVYINPDADSAGAGVFRTQNKTALPGTSVMYPDSTYMAGAGVPSNAETISYWLTRDSTSAYSNEYALFRRVNARPPRLVARGILYNSATDTIFHYFKGDSIGNLTEVGQATLPVIHTAAIHGSQADTGKSALADSIRQVKAQFTSVFHDPRTGATTTRRLDLTIKLMNAGLIHHSTCGNPPLGVLSVTTAVTAANGTTVPQTYVTMSWGASVDDGAGEKDVERYAIYRRLSSVATFDQPIASVPAGRATYSFQDTDVLTGQTWIYGIASQDCTPASSGITQSTAVVIP